MAALAAFPRPAPTGGGPVTRYLLTIPEAAKAIGVSQCHIRRLIDEAAVNRKSRWRFGRELIDLTPVGSQRRVVRININAVIPGLDRSDAA